ncbi:histone deacetylase family protein [Corallincola spongiicola]|uniref:Histone deacetylase n=1 Tax=Corallincola spongiicola TaxID=2520508 RepID=A0ABY1WS73_9GAMM|nr:histone deacetylase [Corallincola spongiicola]TAA47465.1 histone deacetylase [Corallincola spongiicola]
MHLPIVAHPDYSFPFPAGHRFPMDKFGLLQQRMRELGILKQHNLFQPTPCSAAELSMAHSYHYIQRFSIDALSDQELRRMGLPWSEGLRQRTFLAPNGTLLTAELALKYGVACHLAGGTHHAHYDFGSGFCIFNDLAYAARQLIHSGKAKRILIFDCDVHQGDGTARILEDDPEVFTCSIHCEKNFPHRKAISDLDVGLEKGLGDGDYLKTVEETLLQVIEQAQPELVIYDAGVDVYANDPLGLLNITLDGIRARDKSVINTCLKLKIPIATVIGGGYDEDQIALAARHAIVIEEAAKLFI